jgi:O-antigen/teichoic acid export membrane protein
MGVSLYASRVVLNVLGVQDFGIYSVIGGVVALFAFLNSAMSSATQRFFAIDIGKKDWLNLGKTFNATLVIHICIALIILVIAETFGLWFINHKLNLPPDRMDAARFVYQFSIFLSVVSITQVPFNALIVAHERMNIFAIFSIFEAVANLTVIYFLYVSPFDHLKTYSILLFILGLVISTIYKIYCLKHFKESEFKWNYDKEMFKTLISYCGWNLFGNAALVAKGEGTNMLLNIFFGTIINASYGIMMQVQNAVNLFVSNFQMAVNPQIIKFYASKEIAQMQKLMFQSSKFSYFLMFVLSGPLVFNINFILHWWLKNPPKYTAVFIMLCVVNLMIECLSRPLITGALATGKIKWYQITVGTILFLNLPTSYFAFRTYHDPVVFLYVAIAFSLITMFLRLLFLRQMIGLKLCAFLIDVILPAGLVTAVAIGLTLGLKFLLGVAENFYQLVGVSAVVVSVNVLVIILLGFKKLERRMLFDLLLKRFRK